MSGHGILKYFRSITHKMYAPEDKDPPEGKDLSYPIYLGYIYQRLYHRHHGQLSAVLNANVIRVLKQAKRSFTKHCYTKLTPAQRCEIYKFSTFASTL